MPVYLAIPRGEEHEFEVPLENVAEARTYASRNPHVRVFTEVVVDPVKSIDDPRAHIVPAQGGVTAWGPKFLK